METNWRPEVGQVVLVEVVRVEPPIVLTGAVEQVDAADGASIVVDLGASAPAMPDGDGCPVTASFFNPEALYVAHATADRTPHLPRLIELHVTAMAAIQRRAAPRVSGTYPVALGAFTTDDYVSVAGETVDLAPGGCRVVVSERLPEGVCPTVCITLVDRQTVVAQARVLEDREDAGRWEYRLAFDEIDEPDRRRLASLVGA